MRSLVSVLFIQLWARVHSSGKHVQQHKHTAAGKYIVTHTVAQVEWHDGFFAVTGNCDLVSYFEGPFSKAHFQRRMDGSLYLCELPFALDHALVHHTSTAASIHCIYMRLSCFMKSLHFFFVLFSSLFPGYVR